MRIGGYSVFLFGFLLSSCGTFTPREVAEPSNVTLRRAIFDVAETLRDVQDVTPPGKKSGLMADEVTVTFNIAASSTTTNNADLTVSNVPVGTGALEASAGTKNVSDASRGNQIVVKFRNIATADMTKGVYSLKQFQGASNAEPGPKKEKQNEGADEQSNQNTKPPSKDSASKDEKQRPGESIQDMCKRTGLCTMKKKEQTY
ncbi:hypothetical protein ACC676_08660 [Rhizobium ruizarguesonis]|uniref:hypothetical protein n=1 Tax=Rhizobium ruizarguesonis TaxID=2081791 RepID=UPI0005B30E62|nr:hypothetical protein [Rhizobium ruizarguesonis]QJS29290.1 hypothetical protein RLTA1_19115 [Rhizobium leguminosarum bv. trifolii TA1]UFW93448.1 hypothetical protein RlegTA1_19075 [Rhizobium ruizarguesonis]